jgi:hypothetical protein
MTDLKFHAFKRARALKLGGRYPIRKPPMITNFRHASPSTRKTPPGGDPKRRPQPSMPKMPWDEPPA